MCIRDSTAVSTSAKTARPRISALGRSAAPAAVSGGATCTSAPMDAISLDRPDGWIRVLAIFAMILATINMFGGFAVTQRMLAMFRK